MLTSSQILSIQSVLAKRGFLHSKPNGVWDRLTQEAYNGYLLKYANLSNRYNGLSLNLQPNSIDNLPLKLTEELAVLVLPVEPKSPESLLKDTVKPIEPLEVEAVQEVEAPVVKSNPPQQPVKPTYPSKRTTSWKR